MKKVKEKNEHIEKQIEALKRNEKIIQKLGTKIKTNKDLEIDFQQARLDNLNRLESMTQEEILAEKTQLENDYPELIECKYGVLKGFNDEQIMLVVKMEQLDLALTEVVH
jgi:hypothetical protein